MNKMKATGVPWLPEIAEDFSLGYVKQYFYVSKDLSDEGEPERVLKLARAGIVEKDVTTNEGQMAASYAGYNKVQVGDLLLNPMDLYSGANCNVSELNGVISPAYSNLRAKKAGSVVPKFYDYYFKSQYWLMAMFAHGKGVSFDNRWTLNNDSLCAYEIPVAPYAVQQHIVERIQSEERKVDTLIANVQAQIEKLKAYKQSLITKVVTKGLDPNVPMKDSGIEWIGEIPVHWNLWRIGDIGDFKKGPFGSAVKKEMFVEKGPNTYKVYEQKNAIYKDISLGYYYLSQEDYDRLETFSIQTNDIIVSCAGTIGEAYIVPDNYEKGIINQALMRIRLNERLNAEFFIYVFSCIMNLETPKYSNGSAMKNIPPFNYLLKFLLPCPPEKEQMQIVEYISKKSLHIDRLIAIKEAKIEKLEQYKKSLIYEYVTGKKEVH